MLGSRRRYGIEGRDEAFQVGRLIAARGSPGAPICGARTRTGTLLPATPHSRGQGALPGPRRAARSAPSPRGAAQSFLVGQDQRGGLGEGRGAQGSKPAGLGLEEKPLAAWTNNRSGTGRGRPEGRHDGQGFGCGGLAACRGRLAPLALEAHADRPEVGPGMASSCNGSLAGTDRQGRDTSARHCRGVPHRPRSGRSVNQRINTACDPPCISSDLTAAEERVFDEHPVDLFHQRQRVRGDANRRVVERRPAEPYQLALLTDTELRVVPLDHRAFLLRAHRFSPSDKKSFSTANLPILACSSFTSASVGPFCLPPENTSAMPSMACRFHVLTWFGCN